MFYLRIELVVKNDYIQLFKINYKNNYKIKYNIDLIYLIFNE